MKTYVIIIIVVSVLIVLAAAIGVTVFLMMRKKSTTTTSTQSVDSANASKMSCASSLLSIQASFNTITSNNQGYLVDAQSYLDIGNEAVNVSTTAATNAALAAQRASVATTTANKNAELANASTAAAAGLNAKNMALTAMMNAANVADLTTGLKNNAKSSISSYKTKGDISMASMKNLLLAINSLQSQADYLINVVTNNMPNSGTSAPFYTKCQTAYGNVTAACVDGVDKTTYTYSPYSSLASATTADIAYSLTRTIDNYINLATTSYNTGLTAMADLFNNYTLGQTAAGKAHGYVRAPAILNVKSTIVPSANAGPTYTAQYSLAYVALNGAKTDSAIVSFPLLGTTSKLSSMTITLATADATSGTLTLQRRDNAQTTWKTVDSRVQGTSVTFNYSGVSQLGPVAVYTA